MWNLYTQAAAKEGYQAGTENFGYLQKVFVAETEEKAQELGKLDLYGGGLTHFARGEWMFPPGYNSKEATRRMARQFSDPNNPNGPALFQSLEGAVDVEALKKAVYAGYESAQKNNQIIVGTPKSVIPRLKHILDVLRPGIFAFWQNDGPIPTEARRTSMRLIAQEVIPPLREHAKKLGLKDPFERTPGSTPLGASGKPEPVAHAEALAATA
jgi:alkanesulfonate monooxygenase SsuD/methylene tetrahydromethanopterin reductase-like flavin-dependent oxidoreductase (luciferase family)